MIISGGNFQLDKSGNVTLISGTVSSPTFKIYLNSTSYSYVLADSARWRSNTGYAQIQSSGAIGFFSGLHNNTSWFATNSTSSETVVTANFNNRQINLLTNSSTAYLEVLDSSSRSYVYPSYMQSKSFNNTSLESIKKNIFKIGDVLNIIKKSEIYTYNYKNEEDTVKKHTGFVIGENYSTPDEVISQTGDGIDTYSMSSIVWRGVQQIIEKIENLQDRIKILEGSE